MLKNFFHNKALHLGQFGACHLHPVECNYGVRLLPLDETSSVCCAVRGGGEWAKKAPKSEGFYFYGGDPTPAIQRRDFTARF
jgi:hypothetical protein